MNKLQLFFRRLLHNTPVDITNEHMGSQSVLFEGTVEVAPLHNGPLRIDCGNIKPYSTEKKIICQLPKAESCTVELHT